jgi:hypothetical protein
MKRILVIAVLAGAVAASASAARAQGPGGAAPMQSLQGQNAQPQNVQPQNIQPAPADTNVVQPEASRGALGGLASGAPGVAQNVQQLGQGAQAPVVGENGAVSAAAPAAGGAVAGGAVAGGTAVVGSTTTTVVATQQPLMSKAQRHWLVGRTLHHCMFFSDFQPHVIRRGAMPIGFHPGHFFVAPGDLELTSVGMVADGLADKGPVYRITLRNNSTLAARHFRVSLIATLGEITQTSPVVTMNIEELAAGAVGTIDVQLPHGVMTLGPQGQPGPFTTLIAAIDSFDELIETNELNNVATFTRGEIAVIETTVEAPAAAAAAPAAVAPGAGAPAAAPAEAPAQGAPAPAAPSAPAPQDGSDQLDLENVDGASELLSR